MNTHTLLVGMKNGTATLKNMLVAFKNNVKHIPTIWSRFPTTKYLLKRNENIYPHRELYMSIYRNFIDNHVAMNWTLYWNANP